MMKAFKCDKCKRYFEGEVFANIEGTNVVTFTEGGIPNWKYPMPSDLCQECWEEIRRFIEDHGDDQ